MSETGRGLPINSQWALVASRILQDSKRLRCQGTEDAEPGNPRSRGRELACLGADPAPNL